MKLAILVYIIGCLLAAVLWAMTYRMRIEDNPKLEIKNIEKKLATSTLFSWFSVVMLVWIFIEEKGK